ncbi:MAG TPA: hypothetical protein VK718_07800 [Ferruginibacter sp.]|jgi:hypothetical protein|nr:hypothetical protein [Ferruginibacter sp.]
MISKILEKLNCVEKLLRSQKEILNVKDLSVLTGWSPSFIYKQTMARTIPHFKVSEDSRTLFFKRVDIEAHLTKHKVLTVEELEQEATNYFIKKSYKNDKK